MTHQPRWLFNAVVLMIEALQTMSTYGKACACDLQLAWLIHHDVYTVVV